MTKIGFPFKMELLDSLEKLSHLAIQEDLPSGDLTSQSLELIHYKGKAKLITRESIVMNGALWYSTILDKFRIYFPNFQLEIEEKVKDGTFVQADSTLFELSGNLADIMAFERTFLNFLGRGIGIATRTHKYVSLVRQISAKTQVLDTRKTLPGFRYFDKYSVLCGNGTNHRMGLSDMILVKENHISRFKSIAAVLHKIQQKNKTEIKIQIEVESLDQLAEALDLNCEYILLDNFSPEMVKIACEMPRGKSILEVSGGINLKNIKEYVHPHLDRISVGSLTHSIQAPDLSLLMMEG